MARAAIALAVLLLGGLGGLACRAPVLSGLAEAEANDVVVTLGAAQIAAQKERDATGGPHAFRVEVPAAEVARALQALQAAGLPRREPSGLDALERGAGLVATPEEERARLDAATAGELARSLMRLPGVRDARVHLTHPARPAALDQAVTAPKAAVLLLRSPDAPPVPEESVRALLAAAIADLAPEAVAVVQAEASRAPARASEVVAIGPISVPRGSAHTLRALLAAALVLHLLLAAALIAVVARGRRAALGDARR